MSAEKSQSSMLPQVSSSIGTTIATEFPSLLTNLLPMMNRNESTATALPSQSKQSTVLFSSNNGVIDDPFIQSLAAEQAASAHNYDLLSHRHKRVRTMHAKCHSTFSLRKVRRPLRYGDQSTRPSNVQLLLGIEVDSLFEIIGNCVSLDANINAQQTAAANQRLIFNAKTTTDLTAPSINLFRSDDENPSEFT